MKAPRGVENLADRLTVAASTPLVVSPVAEATPLKAVPVKAAKPAKRTAEAARPVFLRLDAALFERYQAKATARTKQTGRGVSIQQVIIERLEEGA